MASTVTKTRIDQIEKKTLQNAFLLMHTARRMAAIYDEQKTIASKYVHSTSRGHEAIQLGSAMQLTEKDYASFYYRDESMLLGIGMEPYELMLQLMAKADDPFSSGRTYYGHPSLRRKGFPIIPHQSSATGMQAIPATGMAHGLKYKETVGLLKGNNKPVVLCSLGDGSITEGEVSEAFQMAVLKELPIIYLVQDNDWGISATGAEMRGMDAFEFAAGFKGLERMQVDGSDFIASYLGMKDAFAYARHERKPILVHAPCPLLGHHTSGVRKEWYRTEQDLSEHQKDDPIPKLHEQLLDNGWDQDRLDELIAAAEKNAEEAFERAKNSTDPETSSVQDHEFAETAVTREHGERMPANGEKHVMVDAALHAMKELLSEYPEALLYGQDVGGRLGGVFREAATLADQFGHDRVFNTPIQEAYIIGSTAGMSAVGCKPIVEIQFADYIWPGINQLVEELSKSCYLSAGKFPIQSLIRVPVGAYGGGGPYHSGSVESTLLNIRGIKVVFPSNTADMKGLMKAAFHDPNPVVMLEHKGLYWSKVPGTELAKTIEPDADYIIPLGKARMVLERRPDLADTESSVVIITYGMGVYWSLAASRDFPGRVTILDLRTLNPIDWQMIEQSVKDHNRVLLVTEEPLMNSFAESLAGRISSAFFEWLDAPVQTIGALNLPAIPLNVELEKAMLPNSDTVRAKLDWLLAY
jgi:2-oxoisovalerate dehydrogenase E1 component